MRQISNPISNREFDSYADKRDGDFAYLVEALHDSPSGQYKKGDRFTLRPQYNTLGACAPVGDEVICSALNGIEPFRVVALKAAGYVQPDTGDYQ